MLLDLLALLDAFDDEGPAFALVGGCVHLVRLDVAASAIEVLDMTCLHFEVADERALELDELQGATLALESTVASAVLLADEGLGCSCVLDVEEC